MASRFWICLALGFVPVIIYPWILIVNLMTVDASLPFPFKAFFWTSLAYPVVYTYCAAVAIIYYANRGKYEVGVRIAIVPLLYLVLVIAFYCWSVKAA